MGQHLTTETQDREERALPPLSSYRSTFRAWLPILRKLVAITVGGLGLAGIGALSMAQSASPRAGTTTTGPTHLAANALAPTEWLAPVPDSEPTLTPAHTSQTASTQSPPCPPSTAETPNDADAKTSASALLPDGRIVLNLASASELTKLPGVGPKRADAIVELRTKMKGFRKLSDLLRVKGIGVKSLRKLEPKLVLDVPKPSG